ncbi:isoaspartyl dipeptidase [Dethiosulfovibrio peptidovorans DSM 11002]|jgi:beta-aspartyl-dipeptidase (metallo-type)|uniref:Isoaspartyl dipeptidase n=1 Tax=Dethiosulfovibrio peptidovorans DSM 11002 TaxID=469381 RepID=D2Z640_9BACT|nr:isoaspartyl dipeptidase [Dethiosulfovibrio peptidovorans DSM 11002]
MGLNRFCKVSPLLIKGGTSFFPVSTKTKTVDFLSLGGRIESVEPSMDELTLRSVFPDLKVLDAGGCKVVPGFIDQHNHFNGAGGEGGPEFRTPPAELSSFLEAGVTGAVGLLGTDGVSRSLEELLAKARGLEAEGLSTWIYTGSYRIPSPAMTGSIMRDMVLIDKVIGVKMALSDHRCSHPSVQEIRRLVSDVRTAGMLSGKFGVVCVHMGSESSGLGPVREALRGLEVPPGHFVPTHVGRTDDLLKEAVDLVLCGGRADITADDRALGAIEAFLRAGADLSSVTLSSDGNGSLPKFDDRKRLIGMAMGSPRSLMERMKSAVDAGLAPLETVVAMVTSNVADGLGLRGKGRLERGYDSDLVVLTPDLSIRHVVSRGRVMMEDGEVAVKGVFES